MEAGGGRKEKRFASLSVLGEGRKRVRAGAGREVLRDCRAGREICASGAEECCSTANNRTNMTTKVRSAGELKAKRKLNSTNKDHGTTSGQRILLLISGALF
jgi:hypothetical protein